MVKLSLDHAVLGINDLRLVNLLIREPRDRKAERFIVCAPGYPGGFIPSFHEFLDQFGDDTASIIIGYPGVSRDMFLAGTDGVEGEVEHSVFSFEGAAKSVTAAHRYALGRGVRELWHFGHSLGAYAIHKSAARSSGTNGIIYLNPVVDGELLEQYWDAQKHGTLDEFITEPIVRGEINADPQTLTNELRSLELDPNYLVGRDVDVSVFWGTADEYIPNHSQIAKATRLCTGYRATPIDVPGGNHILSDHARRKRVFEQMKGIIDG